MIGQVLGSYRVVSRLGAGGMGSIWLAEHQLLGSRAAIKVLLPEMSEQKKIVQRFFDEARAATRIQDPGIVTVLDFGWHEGQAYLVMEYLIGETLADRLKRQQRLPVVQAVRIAQQIAITMASAHARGIVHRDLKPDNIYIVADPVMPGGERIKILDFGIAKLIDNSDASTSRTQTGVIMGTPAFMSPEQCRGAGGVDHRTDIYALGCVLFDMLCGRPPFVAGTPGDLIVAHLRQEPPPPSSLVPGLPADVDALVLRCLAKDADARFATMTQLVRDCALVTGDEAIATIPPLRASQPPPLTPMPVPSQTVATSVDTTLAGSTGQTGHATAARHRPWRGGIVLAIAIAAAGIVIAIVATRDSPPSPSAAPSRPTPIDAAIELATTPTDALLPDAAVTQAPPSRTPTRVPVRRPGAPAHATSGSATPKPHVDSGSSSAKPYDPYGER